jgi:hypothetical protein
MLPVWSQSAASGLPDEREREAAPFAFRRDATINKRRVKFTRISLHRRDLNQSDGYCAGWFMFDVETNLNRRALGLLVQTFAPSFQARGEPEIHDPLRPARTPGMGNLFSAKQPHAK